MGDASFLCFVDTSKLWVRELIRLMCYLVLPINCGLIFPSTLQVHGVLLTIFVSRSKL